MNPSSDRGTIAAANARSSRVGSQKNPASAVDRAFSREWKPKQSTQLRERLWLVAMESAKALAGAVAPEAGDDARTDDAVLEIGAAVEHVQDRRIVNMCSELGRDNVNRPGRHPSATLVVPVDHQIIDDPDIRSGNYLHISKEPGHSRSHWVAVCRQS